MPVSIVKIAKKSQVAVPSHVMIKSVPRAATIGDIFATNCKLLNSAASSVNFCNKPKMHNYLTNKLFNQILNLIIKLFITLFIFKSDSYENVF